MRESGYAWPIVDLKIRYAGPAAYAQRLLVRARIVEWEHRLRIEYEIRDALSNRRLNRASTVQVAVEIATREMCYISPPVLWQRLGVQP
jgi:acyl-CoA thioester hydrolase